MINNYYKRTVNYINNHFPKDQRKRLLMYFDSDLFQIELDKLMENQANVGERLTITMATECLLDSQADRESDEDLTFSTMW